MKVHPTITHERLVITVDELARILKIGRNAAYELVYSKGFPAFKYKKAIRIDYEGLKDWIKAQTDCKQVSSILTNTKENN